MPLLVLLTIVARMVLQDGISGCLGRLRISCDGNLVPADGVWKTFLSFLMIFVLVCMITLEF